MAAGIDLGTEGIVMKMMKFIKGHKEADLVEIGDKKEL